MYPSATTNALILLTSSIAIGLGAGCAASSNDDGAGASAGNGGATAGSGGMTVGTGGGGTGGTGAGGGGPVVGERIAYTLDNELYTANNDGSDAQLIRPKGMGDVVSPAWSADATEIVFAAREDSSTPWSIYVVDADGQNERTVAAGASFDGAGNPSFTPDGRVVFQANAGGHFDIIITDTDGSNSGPLIATAASEASPALSPDGSKIAYQSDTALWIADGDGSNPTPLVDSLPELFTVSPTWSPDGSWVYFSAGDFEANIYRVRPDGTDLEQLSTTAGGEYSPSVSVDGQTVSVYHFGSTPAGVWSLDVATGDLSLLIDGGDNPAHQP